MELLFLLIFEKSKLIHVLSRFDPLLMKIHLVSAQKFTFVFEYNLSLKIYFKDKNFGFFSFE